MLSRLEVALALALVDAGWFFFATSGTDFSSSVPWNDDEEQCVRIEAHTLTRLIFGLPGSLARAGASVSIGTSCDACHTIEQEIKKAVELRVESRVG